MATEKSGMWFLELILNVLLLGGVAFVTFAARGEQERGLAVPLFAAVSPAATRPAVETPGGKPTAPDPGSLAPAITQAVGQAAGQAGSQANQVAGQAGGVAAQGNQAFLQAWGALQIWAAGLDGKITPDELKKIQDNLAQQGWSGTLGVRDYLKSVNDRINSGQADQVIHDSLETLGRQSNAAKVKAMDTVAGLMQSNHISLDQIQRTMGQWATQVLHMSPADIWNSIKF